MASIELNMEMHSINDFMDVVRSFKGPCGAIAHQKQAVVKYVVLSIWKQCNDLVFYGTKPNPAMVFFYTHTHSNKRSLVH